MAHYNKIRKYKPPKSSRVLTRIRPNFCSSNTSWHWEDDGTKSKIMSQCTVSRWLSRWTAVSAFSDCLGKYGGRKEIAAQRKVLLMLCKRFATRIKLIYFLAKCMGPPQDPETHKSCQTHSLKPGSQAQTCISDRKVFYRVILIWQRWGSVDNIVRDSMFTLTLGCWTWLAACSNWTLFIAQINILNVNLKLEKLDLSFWGKGHHANLSNNKTGGWRAPHLWVPSDAVVPMTQGNASRIVPGTVSAFDEETKVLHDEDMIFISGGRVNFFTSWD